MSPSDWEESPRSVDSLAAETERGADSKTGLDARVVRYSKARFRAQEMFDYTRENGHAKQASRLAACGEYLVFRWYHTIDKIRLHAAQFCKQHLICPLCAIRRGAKALKAYLDRYEVIRLANPSLRPFLVTFTVKNGPDLSERFDHLRRNLQRMHKYRLLKRGYQVDKAQAGVWGYEVTNRGNGWHPHAHAIWLCEEMPNMEFLTEEWRNLTGDSFIVDVRPIDTDTASGFCEVFKYAMKFGDLTLADNWEAAQVLKGERLIASFGLFRGVEIPETLLDDEICLEDLPYIELLYRYGNGMAGYLLEKTSAPSVPLRVGEVFPARRAI
jgi:hypothetical protein